MDMSSLMNLAGQASQMMGGLQQGFQQQPQQQQQQHVASSSSSSPAAHDAPPPYSSSSSGGGDKQASAPVAEPSLYTGPRAKAGERPSPPSTPASSLPPFPEPLAMHGLGKAGAMDMGALLKMSGQIMGAMKSHQSDPHLSKEDNAVALADKVQGASGTTSYEQALLNTSTILARDFLPRSRWRGGDAAAG